MTTTRDSRGAPGGRLAGGTAQGVTPRAVSAVPGLPAQHGLLRSAVLHLLPGLLCLGFYLATAPLFLRWGYPPLMSSIATIPLIVVPWMLGWLTLEARRTTGRWAPMDAVSYREPVPFRRLVAWSVALVAWGAVAFGMADALGAGEAIRGAFAGLPEWFLHPAGFDAIVAMQAPQLAVFLASMVLFVGVVAPVVEELYFRGYLMPALGRFGAWAPVFGVALFTLYHLESPWDGPVRFLVVLPMAFGVWRLRSVRLGIVVHVALNTLSALALIVAVLAAR
ncbi:MAG TPA: CPBP family intramembrane glutamic endopeptidase [Longimicrobiales bacterium]|nr:CPBP family intramembrane glutamic endopeptidase [Longimicrobiales bacterium]